MKVIFTKGIQASGKSTWALEFCQKNTDWCRVSRDDIRRMRGTYWLPKDEDIISLAEKELIVAFLSSGKNVIIDSMNLNEKYVNQMKDFLNWKFVDPISYETKTFEVSLEEAIERDSKRINSVGKDVITKTYEKYFGKKEVDIVEYDEDPSLENAIIVDIDGTVAIKMDRSPYDWNKVYEDRPFVEVIELVKNYHKLGYRIIFLSGREGTSICKELTNKWIKDFIFTENESYDLFMRAEGDHRKDSIVKKELFENNIRNKYFIRFVLDDRDQVVSMWRKEIGLTCLQVNYGDF